MCRRTLLLVCCSIVAVVCSTSLGVAQDSNAAKYLYEGKAQAGIEDVKQKLAAAKSDQLELELGTLQFFAALESLAQEFAEHGKTSPALGMIPFLRMDVGEDVGSEPISYEEFRDVIEDFQTQIDGSFETLSGVEKDDVKLTLDLAKVYLDINQNKVGEPGEEFLTIVGRAFSDLRSEEAVVVDFDKSDAIWLQGYCSLASAMCDFALAIDFEESWNLGAAAIFDGAQTTYEFQKRERELSGDYRVFVDLVAAVHKSTWEVEDRQRMINCHNKLLGMVELSRKNWKSIQAETDHEREWLPSPTQAGFLPRLRVQQDMVNAWGLVLSEWESILQGKKLVPFWRDIANRKGVNLKRLFYELEEIDPIMIIQGAPMLPFLEEGPIATAAEWERLTRTFQGNFVGFAVWAN